MDQALFRILDIIKTMTRNNRAFFDLKKLLPIGILLFGTLVVMATMWWSAARDRQQTTKLLTDPDALRALEEEVRQSPQAIEKSFCWRMSTTIGFLSVVAFPKPPSP